jgi:hypothetical protein
MGVTEPEEVEPQAGRAEYVKRRRLAGTRIAILVPAVVVLVAALVVALVLLLLRGSGGPSVPRAAIVDQLSLTVPNPEFVQAATETLEGAGYLVDYYPGEEVTVQFYRDLATHGYKLIILRVHSGRLRSGDLETLTDDVTLFSAEPYSRDMYEDEQRERRLAVARYFAGQPDPQRYFGIVSDFIGSSMRGNLDGAIVLLMGCDTLRSDRMAQAFVRRGAKAVVGWSDLVSSPYMDAATERLLHHLAVDHYSAQEAVTQAMAEVGSDSSSGSVLRVYSPGG